MVVEAGVRHLSICGCGPGSRLELRANLEVKGVRSLRITDLAMRIERTAQFAATQCGDIVLEGLVVTGPARQVPTPKVPDPVLGAIHLDAETSVRVAACRIRFVDAKYLSDPKEGLERLLTPINQSLGELLSTRFDDDSFPKQKAEVAKLLAALNKDARATVVTGIQNVMGGPTTKEPPVDRGNIRNGLRLLRNVIEPSTFPTIPPTIPPTFPPVSREALTASLAYLREVTLEAFPTVALSLGAISADATLVDNQILGTVCVYGGRFRDAEEDLKEAERKILAGMVRKARDPLNFIPAGRLSVARNQMSRLAVGDATVKVLQDRAKIDVGLVEPVPVYHSAYIGQNRFSADRFSVLARDVYLTDNYFLTDNGFDLVPGGIVGWVFAETSTYVGNTGSSTLIDASAKYNSETHKDLNKLTITHV